MAFLNVTHPSAKRQRSRSRTASRYRTAALRARFRVSREQLVLSGRDERDRTLTEARSRLCSVRRRRQHKLDRPLDSPSRDVRERTVFGSALPRGMVDKVEVVECV
jgi:hypothetical protein